jgi:soluble lytic murein transglycosylase
MAGLTGAALVVAASLLAISPASAKTTAAAKISPLTLQIPRQKPPVPPISILVSDEDYRRIDQAFDAMAKRRWSTARNLIGIVEDDIARDILTWSFLTRRGTKADFSEIMSFAERRSDWPKIDTVLKLAETALPGDMPADQVIAWFAGQEPLTGEGKLTLGEAYLALGQDDFGKVWIGRAWVEHNFGRKREKEILLAHKKNISQAAHNARVERLMWQRQHTMTRRVIKYADKPTKAVARARMQISANPNAAQKTVYKLPKNLRRNAGVLFDQVYLTRRIGKDDKVRPLLLAAPDDADGMVEPERWWVERHLHARKAHNKGDYDDAYKIASAHGLTSGAKFAEAEFLSGWLALTYLNKPDVALAHFETLESGVSFPISVSRARYWQGRAAEALGDAERARLSYMKAGEFSYTFYGQLALSNPLVDAPALMLPDQQPDKVQIDWTFENSDFEKAIRLLHAFDRARDVRSFFYHYAGYMEHKSDFERLANLALELDYTHFSIRVAKKAMQRNITLIDLAYPLHELPEYQGKGKAPEPALVIGLSRQESEFNARAVSAANARGLMQLIPSTARLTARKHGMKYNTSWLLDDPSYNTQLGMAHLSDELTRFDGSYILTIAGYNAGPHRVKKWIKDYGDPRTDAVDPVDWVESIPFKETRNYVQRVLENKQVYQNRLAGQNQPLQLTEDLARSNSRTLINLPAIRAAFAPLVKE